MMAEQHKYRPAPGSAERAAWDQLDASERELCDGWVYGSEPPGSAGETVADLPDPRRQLVLAALGYGTAAHRELLS